MGEIEQIFKQFNSGRGEWKKFIQSIKIDNIHGWHGQVISFEYPIVAIVGENGIGKSTFLKAAACAYKVENSDKDFYPSKMFMSTQWDKVALDGAMIEYVIREGDQIKTLRWKKSKDWGFSPKNNKPKRKVYFLDISRTLPLDATAGYAKIAMTSNAEAGERIEFSEESIRDISYVLGQEYTNARFVGTNIDSTRQVGLLTSNYGEVSQFHQGAGEDSILDMFKLLQDIPNQSLLIIDEVENSLHPRAQRRFIKYLLKVARKKKLQIIVSTHSPFVLDELPLKARVMLIRLSDRKDVIYEVTSKFALSTIDELSHPELYVHLEDEEAVTLFWEILKTRNDKYDELMKKIETVVVGSSSVISTLIKLEKEGRLPYKSISLPDGDMKGTAEVNITLPGNEAPERVVFLGLKEKGWNKLEERFGIGAGLLYSYLDAATLLPNHHDWCVEVGNKVKKSKNVIWSIMVEEWCKQCLNQDEADALVDYVLQAIS